MPARLRALEPQTPQVHAKFSHQLIRPVETPAGSAVRHRVGLLTGCVQDLVFPDINRDTADALLANGCEVHTPSLQVCCGSLHAHNGDLESARALARRLLDTFDLTKLDFIVTNAAGCGGHLKGYGRLLAEDPAYAERAAEWSRKCKDVNELLVSINFRPPVHNPGSAALTRVTYHEACHLCHGQKIFSQPREILRAIPGLELVELTESTWCCGSAGIYNIVQPEMSAKLLDRKLGHIEETNADIVATANPGCHLQLVNGIARHGGKPKVEIHHPVSLLAAAYRGEKSKVIE